MNNFCISTFYSSKDNMPKKVNITWDNFTAWVKEPQIRAEKDGAAFAPCIFEPELRRNENVKEISMLVFDIDEGCEFEKLRKKLQVLDSAFSIYSTHSHKRNTEKNPNAESRFRVCIPLAEEIAPNNFHNLWQVVNDSLDLKADKQAKDVARLHYKPVKASEDAPYEFYIEAHSEGFKWSEYLRNNENLISQNKDNENPLSQFISDTPVIFSNHEERHSELCNRIEIAGKLNSRGNYEMRCPVHNGKTQTSFVYFPENKAVKCLKGCDYFEILNAFGLPDNHFPDFKYETKKEKPLNIICLADIETDLVSWLWFPYIPRGKLTIISGEEGLGKSWLTCAFASSVTTGSGFPLNFESFEPGNVLMLSAEDGLADTIKPRLESCGADVEKIFAPNEAIIFDEKGLIRFEMYISEVEPALVTIDPLFAYTSARADINSANQSRSISSALATIAENYDCAIVLIRHISKSKGMGDARAAGLGSIDWRAAVRSELLVGKNPHDEIERAIIQTKNNLAPLGDSIGFIIEGNSDKAILRWTGKSNLTAEKILSSPENNGGKIEQSEAIAFLQEALLDGKRPAKEVSEEATLEGFSPQNLRTARKKLGVISKKEGGNFGGDQRWVWVLPNLEDVSKN